MTSISSSTTKQTDLHQTVQGFCDTAKSLAETAQDLNDQGTLIQMKKDIGQLIDAVNNIPSQVLRSSLSSREGDSKNSGSICTYKPSITIEESSKGWFIPKNDINDREILEFCEATEKAISNIPIDDRHVPIALSMLFEEAGVNGKEVLGNTAWSLKPTILGVVDRNGDPETRVYAVRFKESMRGPFLTLKMNKASLTSYINILTELNRSGMRISKNDMPNRAINPVKGSPEEEQITQFKQRLSNIKITNWDPINAEIFAHLKHSRNPSIPTGAPEICGLDETEIGNVIISYDSGPKCYITMPFSKLNSLISYAEMAQRNHSTEEETFRLRGRLRCVQVAKEWSAINRQWLKSFGPENDFYDDMTYTSPESIACHGQKVFVCFKNGKNFPMSVDVPIQEFNKELFGLLKQQYATRQKEVVTSSCLYVDSLVKSKVKPSQPECEKLVETLHRTQNTLDSIFLASKANSKSEGDAKEALSKPEMCQRSTEYDEETDDEELGKEWDRLSLELPSKSPVWPSVYAKFIKQGVLPADADTVAPPVILGIHKENGKLTKKFAVQLGRKIFAMDAKVLSELCKEFESQNTAKKQ